jgi:hypothetical protein
MKITIESDQALENTLPTISSPATAGLNGGAATNPASDATDELKSSHETNSIDAGNPPSWLIQELSATARSSELSQVSAVNGGAAPMG